MTPDSDYGDMKPIEHVLLHSARILSHLMCSWNINTLMESVLYIIEHFEVADEFFT